MPRLISGRNVCFDFSKTIPFAKQLYLGNEGDSPFNFAKNDDLHHLIRVHELIKSSSIYSLSNVNLLPGSLPMDTHLVMRDAGLPLSQLEEYIHLWPQSDQMVIRQFCTSDRATRIFETLFTQINLWLTKSLNLNDLNKNQPSLNCWLF